ncbi:hypothetical protein CW752_00520 [Chryseobacterium sp. PMSZPI]|nr:hypothetical protein CW752_00520 [Chryseobacterium sp. PMSZPI]
MAKIAFYWLYSNFKTGYQKAIFYFLLFIIPENFKMYELSIKNLPKKTISISIRIIKDKPDKNL